MSRCYFLILAMSLLALIGHSEAGCSSCTVHSSRDQDPFFCDDLNANVCKKLNDPISTLAPKPPVTRSTDYLQAGYLKLFKEVGVKTYSEYAALLLKKDFKIDESTTLESKWKQFFTTGTTNALYAELFPELKKCEIEVEKLQNSLRKKAIKPADLQIIRASAVAYRKKLKEELILLQSKDIRSFVQTYFASICSDFKNKNTALIQRDLNPTDAAKCNQYSDIRQEMAYFVDENDPNYRAEAEKFVRKWFIAPEDVFGEFKKDEQGKTYDSETSTNLLVYGLQNVCDFRNDAQRWGVKKAENDIYTSFYRSKPFIETVFDRMVTPDRQTKVKALGEKVRSWTLKKLESMKCAPSETMNTFVEEMKEIPISPYERPKDEDYQTDRFNNRVLKDPARGEYGSATYWLFASPNVAFMNEENATYVSRYGKRKPYIYLSGNDYLNALTDEKTVEADLAHEFGHHVDSNQSMKESHPEMMACYESVLDCLEKSSKNQIRKDQEGETIGDLYAAEYVAAELAKLPHEDRRNGLSRYLASSCRAMNERAENFFDYDTNPHPDWILRINSIFGGNSKIRKILGCNPSSQKVPVCELPPPGGKQE